MAGRHTTAGNGHDHRRALRRGLRGARFRYRRNRYRQRLETASPRFRDTEHVREHGAEFQYRSIETDVLAHCLERVSETRLAELVSRELWQPLGCEESANFTVDRAGYALACGGLNATLRDYGRFGQMLLQRGKVGDTQLVPADWVDDIQNADHSLFGEPYTRAAPNGAYRNQFWIEDVDRPGFMARGVFGQIIYVDPGDDMVFVKLSSWPEFTSVPRLVTTLNAIHAIGNALNR